MTLDLPPCLGPQFPHPSRGASPELAPVEQQASHTPPSAARLPASLTLKGGCSRDAHHRQVAPSQASRLQRRPGSLAGTAAGPVITKLAKPGPATAATVTDAVRPRASPPPRLAPPLPPGTPLLRALARQTNARGSWAQRLAPAKPSP